jgi:hypothetical protein
MHHFSHHSPQTSVTKRVFGARTLRALFSFGLMAAAAASGAFACGDDTTGTSTGGSGGGGGDDCSKGVLVNGVCEGKCEPDLCGFEDNTCVGNRCVLKCTTATDCYADGSQECLPAKEDGTNADILTCQFSGKAAFGEPCSFSDPNDDCFRQSDGAPLLVCPDGGSCDYGACGGAACVKDEAFCGNVPGCQRGFCDDGADPKTPCIVPQCPLEQCRPQKCVSKGDGDVGAYCANPFCQTDDQCGRGYFCAPTRDAHQICNEDPPQSSFCGLTSEPCIDRANFEANGASYFEGAICLMRNSCFQRGLCDPCTDDIDCGFLADGTCADIGGQKRCTKTCANNGDCLPNYQCDVGQGLCLPRLGTCEGDGTFCMPCHDDSDCYDGKPHKPDGPFWGCYEGLNGEKGCFDLSFPDTCTTSNDCPVAPNGTHGHCLGTHPADGYEPGTDTCFLTLNTSNGKFGCWY